jgi:hypothetical protein
MLIPFAGRAPLDWDLFEDFVIIDAGSGDLCYVEVDLVPRQWLNPQPPSAANARAEAAADRSTWSGSDGSGDTACPPPPGVDRMIIGWLSRHIGGARSARQ